MSETPEAAGPRRYRVSLNCHADALGAVIGLLVKEVESPKMEKVGDDFKLSLVCMHDQLMTVLGIVIDYANNLIVAPFVPEVKMGPAVFRPPTPTYVRTELQKDVTYLPAKRHRAKGAPARVSDSGMGVTVLKAFADGGRVKHPADFNEVAVAAGYSKSGVPATISKLVEEGALVRVGHGAYRLPTTQDQLRVMEARDPSFRTGENNGN